MDISRSQAKQWRFGPDCVALEYNIIGLYLIMSFALFYRENWMNGNKSRLIAPYAVVF